MKGRNGVYRVGVKSSTKKLRAKRKALKAWLWTRLREPLEDTLRILNLKLAGHYRYYGVNGNLRELKKFRRYAFNSTYRMLKRRSQRSKLQIQKFQEIWDKQVARPKITSTNLVEPTDVNLKSCMREIRTYGSVRGRRRKVSSLLDREKVKDSVT